MKIIEIQWFVLKFNKINLNSMKFNENKNQWKSMKINKF